MIKCLIIDDEELARTLIRSYIDKIAYAQVVADFENPLEALAFLKSNDIDLLFLDIQMPDLKGTKLAELVPEKCQVIFTTAYAEYALEGFELNAVDYLLKPITFERFLKAIERVKSNENDIDNQSITLKSGYDLHKILLDDIYFIESNGEYVNYHLKDRKIMVYQSLSSLEKELDPQNFIRVHRSYIINKSKVKSLKGRDLSIEGFDMPVSDTYINRVKDELF